jgi:hypothetical protein
MLEAPKKVAPHTENSTSPHTTAASAGRKTGPEKPATRGRASTNGAAPNHAGRAAERERNSSRIVARTARPSPGAQGPAPATTDCRHQQQPNTSR